jgi:autotransporter-associated beta strand protein
MKPKRNLLFSATSLVVVTLSTAAHSQVRVLWTGAESTAWNNGANWATGVVPTNTANPGHHAVINTQTPNFAVISENLAATPVDIFVGVDSGSNGRVDQTAGSASTGSGNWMFVGQDGGNGVYNASGGSLNVGGRLYVGGNGGTGVFNLTGTSSLTVGSEFYVGAFQGASVGNNGTLNVNTTGTLNVGTFFNVGSREQGVGVFNLTAGTVVTTGWFEVGNHGGNGTYNQTGGSLTQQGGSPTLFGTNGATGSGTISGGTLTASGEFWVGNGGGSVGSLTFSDGTLTTPSWVAIGRGGGQGTVNMTGGTWNKTGESNFIVGASGAGITSTMNMSGGVVNVGSHSDFNRGITWIGELNGVTGILNLSGTAQFNSDRVIVGVAGGSNGTLNLNGGTLRTSELSGGGGNAEVVFNGTPLIATNNSNTFISNLDVALINAVGLSVDTQGFTLVSPQTFTGPGGLTKSGSGSLTLTGLGGYTGPTVVQQGTLGLTDSFSGSSSITLGNGASLAVKVNEFDTLEIPQLNFGTGNTVSLDLTLYSDFGNPDVVAIDAAALTMNGDVTVNVAAGVVEVGRFPLITFGSKTGPGNFVLGTLPAGIQAQIITDADSVDLNITSAVNLVWTGAVSGNWDTVTQNWVNLANNTPSVFSNGNPVTFDNFASEFNVVLNQTVQSPNVVFSNTSEDYTLTGTGKISGATALTKTGDGRVTLGTLNDYTGVTRLEGGVVTTATLTNGGVASGIGAATVAPENLVLAGGGLHYTGAATSTNRGVTLAPGGSTLNHDNALTWSGPITSSGGALRKIGNSSLTLTNPVNAFGGVGVGGAVLRVDAGTLNFNGGGSQINTITGEAWIASVEGANAQMVLSDTTVNISSWMAIARGNAGGTASVTLNNSVLTSNGFSTGFNSGSGTQSTVTLNNSSFTNSGNTNIAESTGAVSTMVLNGNSTFNATNARIMIGQAGGTEGTVILNDNSGIVHNGSWVAIGNNGKGTLTMRGNSTFTKPGGDFNVADVQGSDGTLNIEGNAALNLAASTTFVGKGPNSLGTVNMSGGQYNATGNFFVGTNATSTGVWNHTGGAVNVTNNEFRIGANTNATGVWNMGGGTLVKNGGEFFVGAFGNGTFNQTAGQVDANGWIVIGRFRNGEGVPGEGVMNLSGGVFNQTATDRFVQIGEDGVGVLNISGNAVLNIASTGEGIRLGSNGAGVGTFNLNGGTVVTNRIRQGNGTGTINFNGGLVRARTGANTDFISGIATANVLAGGAIIDSNGLNITIAQNLQGPGGFTKLGSGTLTLSGITGYAGNTTVSGGTLTVPNANLPDGATVTISSGATLNLPTEGVDVVAGLVINGVAQPAGIYGSAQTGGVITGPGTLQVSGAAPASPFESWIAGFFPGITNPAIIGPNADPDGDGQSNLLEFALAGDPSDGADNAKIYHLLADTNGNLSREMVLTAAVRTGTPAFAGTPSPQATHDGFTYTIQGSATLDSFPLTVTPVAPVNPGVPAPAGYEYRSFRLEGSDGLTNKGFLRVGVQ